MLPRKGQAKSDLIDLRREIGAQVLTGPTRIVEFDLPVRGNGATYLDDVNAWHDAIADAWRVQIAEHLPGGGKLALLVWGDPSLYDSTLRIADRLRSAGVFRLRGTSGTVTTLASLHLELPQYDRRAVDGLIVPSQSMRDISTRLSRMSSAERKCLPCIGDDRANLVIAGCAILESILDIWPAEQLGVADRGIREGILRSLIAADAEGERSRATVQRMREQDV